jgi:hypothetical protein
MAIRGHIVESDYDLTCNMVTEAERGGICCLTGTGVYGPGMDEANKVVGYAADPSGEVVMGLLLHTVDDYDPTLIPHNFQNPDKVPFGKVTLVRKWRGHTNMIMPAELAGVVPGPAYLGNSGLLTPSGGSGRPTVGRFESYEDSDGFVDVSINIIN